MIPVLDTVSDRRRADLLDRRWPDPEVPRRFARFLAEVLTRLQDTELVAIGVGNEVDGELSGGACQDYGVFLAARAVVHRHRPEVPVGATMTWPGLRANPDAQALARLGGAWLVNHYPLDERIRVLPNGDFPPSSTR